MSSHFNGKIWKNHLAKQGNSELDHLFVYFVSDGTTLTDENGQQFRLRFQEIGLKALSKWDEYKKFEIKVDRLKATNDYSDTPYWVEQENLLKSVPINDINYSLFANALDENVAYKID